MSEGNGKTQEQLREEKEQRFKANPDSFIEMSEIVVAAKRSPKGIAVYVGAASIVELNIAKSTIQYRIDEAFRSVRAANRSTIVHPRSPFKGGARKKMFN